MRLLDATIIIAIAMYTSDKVVTRAAEYDEGDLITSTVAFAEIVRGTARNRLPAAEQFRAFVEEVPVFDFDCKAALAFATLPSKRARHDRLIAVHALSHDLAVVKDNERDSADVLGLRVENWTR